MTQSRRRSDSPSSFSTWKTTTDFCERTREEWKEPFVKLVLLMAAAPPPHHQHNHHHPSTAREELKVASVVHLSLALAMLQVRVLTPTTSALTQPTATKKLSATFTRVSSGKRQAQPSPSSSGHLGFSVIPFSTRPPQIYVCVRRQGQDGQIKVRKMFTLFPPRP